MLCEKCKVNEATVYYTEIIGGVKKELHLCKACSGEYTGKSPFIKSPGDMISNFLKGILKSNRAEIDLNEKIQDSESVVCPGCGMSMAEFITESKFGCSKCIGAFGKSIDDYLKSVQGSAYHMGKIDYRKKLKENEKLAAEDAEHYVTEYEQERNERFDEIKKNRELEKLKRDLQKAILVEDYESAAILRDKIKKYKTEE